MERIPTDPSTCQFADDGWLLPTKAVHLLAGVPGAGKTCLSAWMLRQLRDGAALFGHAARVPTAVGVIVGDRGWASHARWFGAVGLADIPHYSFHDDSTFRWERLKQADGWMWTLLHAIDSLELPRGALLLVDPLGAFLGGDLLNYTRVFCAMGELSQLCIHRELTILGTAHAAKQRFGRQFQYTRPQDRILGTTALVGCADTVMYLATPDETRKKYWELTCAPHHAPTTTFTFTRGSDGLFKFVAAKIAEPGGATSVNLEARRVQVVYAAIGTEPTPINDILERAAQERVSRATVFRALNDLAQAQLIEQCEERGYWRRSPRKPN